MVVRRVVAWVLVEVLVMELVIVAPVGATHVVTQLGTFNLTASGVAKVSNATEKVRLGAQLMQIAGRWSGAVTIAFALFEIGSEVWDWYEHAFNKGSGAPYPEATSSFYALGRAVGSVQVWRIDAVCPSTSPTFKWSVADPSSLNWAALVGMQVTSSGPNMCQVGGPTWMNYTANGYFGTGSGVATTVTAANQGSAMDRAAAVQALAAYRDELMSGAPMSAGGNQTSIQDMMAAAGAPAGLGDPRAWLVRALNDAIGVLNYGVGLEAGDATVSATPLDRGARPAPIAGSGGTAGSVSTGANLGTGVVAPTAAAPDMSKVTKLLDDISQKLNASASVPDAQVCTECTRVDKWAEFWNTLRAAGQAAPVFGLISRLAWPGSGSVQRVWTLGSWRGGELSVDLDSSGMGTAITVTRFVVVGGAVIIAYMILFA